MTPEHWQVVKRVFQSALKRDPAERAAFLESACSGDDLLRAEVQSLIDSHQAAGNFIESSPIESAPLVGLDFGPYRIEKLLGAGGMGEVYLATDSRLGRQVAIKVLPAAAAADPERLRRFEHEARASSLLNHPNIVTMHDVGTFKGIPYLVYELLEGKTVRELLRAGPFTPAKAVDCALQTARGLAQAHARGIIHRDLKPENLFVTDDGRVKILDFGLAKLKPDVFQADRNSTHSTLTMKGVILGTVGYMAPEHVRGEPADHRADIFSLGAILYELIAGQPAFRGDSDVQTMNAILTADPPPIAQIDAAPAIRPIITRCLAKDPADRFQSAQDLVFNLELVSTPGIPRPKLGGKVRRGWFAAAAATAILAAIIAITRKDLPTRPRLHSPAHRQVTFLGAASFPALSPDGKYIAYVDGPRLLSQEIGGGTPIELYRAAGQVLELSSLRWSPDGSRLLVVGSDASGLITAVVPLLGGATRPLQQGAVTCWSPDGSETASHGYVAKQLLIKNVTTGAGRHIALSGSFTWLGDGIDWSSLGRLAFVTFEEPRGVYEIWTIRPDGSEQRKVIEEKLELSSPLWSANGRALYYLRAEGSIRDLVKVAVGDDGGAAGAPEVLLSGLEAGPIISISKDGRRLAYTREPWNSNIWLATLGTEAATRFETRQLTTGTRKVQYPRFSPDGERVAFTMGVPPKTNVFIMPAGGGPAQQITFLDSYCASPAWSADGRHIAFGSTTGDVTRVWRTDSDGIAAREYNETRLSRDTLTVTWAPGTDILYHRPGNRNFMVLDPASGAGRGLLIKNESAGWAFAPRYSRDGRRVAFFWNRPNTGKTGLWTVAKDGGAETLLKEGRYYPVSWSRDGKSIVMYGEHEAALLKLSVPSGRVSKMPALPILDGRSWESPGLTSVMIDASPDGRSFLVAAREERSDVWMTENFDSGSSRERAAE